MIFSPVNLDVFMGVIQVEGLHFVAVRDFVGITDGLAGCQRRQTIADCAQAGAARVDFDGELDGAAELLRTVTRMTIVYTSGPAKYRDQKTWSSHHGSV